MARKTLRGRIPSVAYRGNKLATFFDTKMLRYNAFMATSGHFHVNDCTYFNKCFINQKLKCSFGLQIE